MALEPERFDALNLDDLQKLVDNGEREGTGIEYKAQLNLTTDDHKKEFLADISSLANAKGGFVVFGIEEERSSDGRPTGVPSSVAGIELANPDGELLRVENIARDGIEPRINGLRVRLIPLSGTRSVLLAHVPISLIGPHIVKFKGASRFFSRNSAGKYQLAYSEIRDAFLRGDERVQRLRSFRMERLAKLIAGDHLADLGGNPMIVIHLLPLLDSTLDAVKAKGLNLEPIYSHGWTSTLNFEGALSFSSYHSYVQIFRNGAIEAVTGNLIRGGDEKVIPSYTYEEEILHAAPRFLGAQRALGVSYPIAFCYSLLGVKGATLAVHPAYWTKPSPIPRDQLIIGETLLEDESALIPAVKAAFDLVWQSCGWPKSINFDDNGNWKKQ